MTKDAQDEKAKKRLKMERNLTVIMIFLVGNNGFLYIFLIVN